jgi:hypothetical protein
MEKERILTFNNGEIPNGEYDILRIKNIPNAEIDLNIFKEIILTFLNNNDLNEEASQWEELLPEKLVKFTNQLEAEDYKDDLISHIPAMINSLKHIKDWEWYSSKLIPNGFEVVLKGKFKAIFLPLLHHLGIPHKNLFIERNGIEYPTKAMIDVLDYKMFEPVTFKLIRI